MDVNDIECVVFERVLFGIKNFDMAIIFKDFTTHKRINSIPIEHMEEIKSYLDEICIIYAESEAPFNWNTLLSHIRENFEDWLEEGAWGFLLDQVSFSLFWPCYRLKVRRVVRMARMSCQKTKIQALTTMKRKIRKMRATTQTSVMSQARMLIAKSSAKRGLAGRSLTSKLRKKIGRTLQSAAMSVDRRQRRRTRVGVEQT